MELYEKYGFMNIEQWNFPTIVNLNVFRGACPCRCVHCPVGCVLPDERAERFSKGQISLELFKNVADEIGATSNKGILRIHSVGEPLLWDELVSAVYYSKKKGIKTWIFTSAVTTNTALLERLCENVDIIEVSVNSISESDYLKTKGVDKFDLVKANILYMVEYIKENHLKTRLLCSRVQSDDQQEDDAFLKYWRKYTGIADVFVRSYHNYNGLLDSDTKGVSAITPCLVHWGRFNIDINGDAVVCFNELFKPVIEADSILGNIYSATIEEIWKSDKLNQIRLFQLQKNSHLNMKIPCETCTTCQKYPPHPHTSEKQIRGCYI